MCLQESTGPRPAELGNVDQTESGRRRGVIVKSAQQDPKLFLDISAHLEQVVGLACTVLRYFCGVYVCNL